MRLTMRCVLAATVLATACPAHAVDTNIDHYVVQKLEDFSAVMSVVSANQRELGKISKDAGLLYRFKEIHMRYKEPNKIRIEGAMDGTSAVMIFNGNKQSVSVPKMGIHTRRDWGDSPGKRKTLMDVGLVSEYFLTFTTAHYLREATVDGTSCAVFELRYKESEGDTSHHIVYMDPKTRVVRKRESYNQSGKLQAVYFYKDVEEVAKGIWFPTRVEAMNTDHQVAGVSAYKNIKVNSGIPDTVFQI